jgi:histidinol-phosphate aminotransferase
MTRFSRHLQEHTIQNPFQGMVRLERSLGHPIGARIGSNESLPLDNPALLDLLGPAGIELARLYPDPYAHELRKIAAQINQVNDDEILFDNGADSLILLALRLFCDVGTTVVSSAGTYPAFRYFADGCGVRVVEVSLQETLAGGMEADLGSLACSAHQHKAQLVYLANPDNPTAHYHSQDEIIRFRQSLPVDCALILDEAYLEFASADEARSPVLTNTFRLRTLSKAYALAGLRIGYAVAPADCIAKADEIRQQFALSSLAQAAGLIALQGQTEAKRLIQKTVALRNQLSDLLTQRGLTVLPSWTNFVSVHYPDSTISERVQRQLFNQGIAVHRPPHPAVSHLLRITAHSLALTDTVIDTLSG